MKYPTKLETYRPARNHDGTSHAWQIPTLSGDLSLWKLHHRRPGLRDHVHRLARRVRHSYLVQVSPETLVREQLEAANAARPKLRN